MQIASDFLLNKFMTLGKLLCFCFVFFKISVIYDTYILSCYKDFKKLIDMKYFASDKQ